MSEYERETADDEDRRWYASLNWKFQPTTVLGVPV